MCQGYSCGALAVPRAPRLRTSGVLPPSACAPQLLPPSHGAAGADSASLLGLPGGWASLPRHVRAIGSQLQLLPLVLRSTCRALGGGHGEKLTNALNASWSGIRMPSSLPARQQRLRRRWGYRGVRVGEALHPGPSSGIPLHPAIGRGRSPSPANDEARLSDAG